ncbi:MAG TPA: hypothetical protein VKT32_13510 [Chthonomonadaceae bacterium]|nr:hypothetical protein [Chthonomonadaceae bacterium]
MRLFHFVTKDVAGGMKERGFGRAGPRAFIQRTLAGALLLAASCACMAQKGSPSQHAHPRRVIQSRPSGISLTFSNVDVRDALDQIAKYSGTDILLTPGAKGMISLNLRNRTSDEAIRLTASAAGMTVVHANGAYIVGPASEVQNTVVGIGQTEIVSLHNLTPDQAVSLVGKVAPAVRAEPTQNAVLLTGMPADIAAARAAVSAMESRITAAQEAQGQSNPQVNEVVTLEYTPPGQVAGLLKNMYPDVKADVVGEADKPGGTLGLSGPRSEVEAAKETIHSVDSSAAARQPERTYRTYEIKYSSAPLLKDFLSKADPNLLVLMGPEVYALPRPSFNPISAVSLGGGSSGAGGASGGGGTTGATGGTSAAGGGGGTGGGQAVQLGDRARVLILGGTADELDQAQRLLGKVDVPPRQVMVEVKVIDASPEKIENIGVSYSWNPFQWEEAPPGSPFPLSSPTSSVKPIPLGPLSRVPWAFQAAINLMVQNNEAKLLANPKVQVIEDQDANIFIGETIRTAVSQASLAGTTIQVLEFPVGIILLVHPRINADGNLTLRVHPVVSSVTTLGADGVPNTASREAETSVMIKDGETIVIGGLIQDEMTKNVTEIPILSKIPLIGELFRNRSTDHRHSDVLVFITPHIIK